MALVVLLAILVPTTVFAQELFRGETAARAQDYRYYIKSFYTFAVGAGILIATVLIMVGGFIWVASAGDSGKIEKAKEYIQNAITGVVLLLAVYAILSFISPNLVNLTLPNVNQFGPEGVCVHPDTGCERIPKQQCEASGGTFRENKTCKMLQEESDAFLRRISEAQDQVCNPTQAGPNNCASFVPAEPDFVPLPADILDPNRATFFQLAECNNDTYSYDVRLEADPEIFSADCTNKCKPCVGSMTFSRDIVGPATCTCIANPP